MKRISIALSLLGALPLVALAGPTSSVAEQSAEEVYEELEQEYEQVLENFLQAVRDLETLGKSAAEITDYKRQWDPTSPFAETFLERAGEFAGQPGAVPFLLWVLQHPGDAPSTPSRPCLESLRILLRDHAASEDFVQFVANSFYESYGAEDYYAAIYDTVVEVGGDSVAGLAARFSRARLALRAAAPSEKARVAALADLERVSTSDSAFAEDAKGYLFELTRLQVGMLAPDIAGADLDGIEFKLSDYRGKVVVLDFWGDW